MATVERVRVDVWTWAVRLYPTRSAAADACRAGHVKVNGSSAKPAQMLKPGDQVRVRTPGGERIVVVVSLVDKRVGAPVAAQQYVDHTPPPLPKEERALFDVRARGAGRPTKRDRRDIERLKGWR